MLRLMYSSQHISTLCLLLQRLIWNSLPHRNRMKMRSLRDCVQIYFSTFVVGIAKAVVASVHCSVCTGNILEICGADTLLNN